MDIDIGWDVDIDVDIGLAIEAVLMLAFVWALISCGYMYQY